MSAAVQDEMVFQKEQTLGTFAILRRLLGFAWPHRRLFLYSILLVPAVVFFQLMQPYVIKITIDHYIADSDPHGVVLCSLLYLFCFFGDGVSNFLQNYCINIGAQRALHDLRLKLLNHLLRLPLSFYDRNAVGTLVSRATNDVESINELLVSGVVALAKDIITLVAIVCMLLHLHFKLALLSFILMPLLLAIGWYLQMQMRRAYTLVRRLVGQINGYLAESLSGIGIIKLFQREKRNLDEFNELNERHLKANVVSVNADATIYAVVEAFASITVAGIIWYGGKMLGYNLADGAAALTFGTLVAFIEYLNRFFNPLRDLSGKFATVQMAAVSGERLVNLMQEAQERECDEAVGVAQRQLPVGVRFDGVRLSYVPGTEALRIDALTIEPGERVAVVGATGSGKSSMARLLMRLYEFQSGSIILKVDGKEVDIRGLQLPALRQLIGIVPQEVDIFQGSLAENILLHTGAPTDAESKRILEIFELLKIGQYLDTDMRVEERGANLSAGQKQLLAFARILYYNPSMVILDEATSNIDAETEKALLDAMEIVLKGRTSLLIAHRLSTIQNSDRILVMNRGQIIADGKHAQLMRKSEIYKTLVREYNAAAEI